MTTIGINPDCPAGIHLLADHLDTALAVGEDLLALVLPPRADLDEADPETAPEAIDLYVWMAEPQDVADLHDLCEQRGVPAVRPLGETFYDMVEFAIADCDGRMIVFGA